MIDRTLYGSGQWRTLRRLILRRDSYRCQKCGKAGRLEVDHVIPVHKGGEFWEAQNLQALCRSCHFRKSAVETTRRARAKMHKHKQAWRNMVEDLLNKY